MRPLDPAGGPVERFAGELRALRALAGDLPFWQLARRCDVSKSALAAAAAGRDLPSERVTREFVRACGGDWSWWRARRAQTVADSAVSVEDAEPRLGALVVVARPASRSLGDQLPLLVRSGPHDLSLPAGPGHPARRSSAWRRRAAVRITAVAMTAAVAATLTQAVHSARCPGLAPVAEPPLRPPGLPSPHPVAVDGEDPLSSRCLTDSAVIGVSSVVLREPARLHDRRLPSGTRMGTIELHYSAHCGSAWGDFAPDPAFAGDRPDTAPGRSVTIEIEIERPAEDTKMLWRFTGFYRAYTSMLRTHLKCVLARVRITIAGQDATAAGQTHCLPDPT